jgi:hypothetical protein
LSDRLDDAAFEEFSKNSENYAATYFNLSDPPWAESFQNRAKHTAEFQKSFNQQG